MCNALEPVIIAQIRRPYDALMQLLQDAYDYKETFGLNPVELRMIHQAAEAAQNAAYRALAEIEAVLAEHA